MNFSFETYYLHQDIIDEKFYDSEDDSEEEEEDEEDEDEDKKKKSKKPKKKPYVMDQDHRLLLRVTKPLLQSRNAYKHFLHSCIQHNNLIEITIVIMLAT